MNNLIEQIPPVTIDDSIAKGIKPDTYEIYYHGVVKNKITGRIMSQHNNAKGYPCVNLRMADGRNNSYLVHRLMMKAYYPIENQDDYNKIVIDHKNCKTGDFRFDNLEWVSRKENYDRAYNNGLVIKGEDSSTAILNNSDAIFVCECLSNGIPLKTIEHDLEIRLKDRLGDDVKCNCHNRVRDILTHRKWKHISKDYTFKHYEIKHRKRK